MALLLRPLRPEAAADRDAIAAIWHAGASLPGVGPASVPPLASLRDRVDVELDSGWAVTLAGQRAAIVGFLALRPREAVLDQLFVHPDSLGAGVGRALLAEAKRQLPAGFTLFTRPGNTRACRFYESAGLRRLRDDIHPRFGDPIVFYGWSP